ncbi:MAG: lysophospholipid acyltransferase family protein [Candidatus Zixiibacteriota bacterium]
MTARKIKHKVEYWITYFSSIILMVLPYRLALAFGSFLGFLAFDVFRVRREVALRNLRNCLGDQKNSRELRKIGRRAYKNIGKSFVEYSLFPSLNKEKISKLVEFVGVENFDEALRRGKGAILVAGHFGSWELMGAAIRQRGYPVDFLVGEQRNILVDSLMNDYRKCMGIGIIKMGAAAKGVIKALKDNRFVAMLSDQDAGDDGAVVNFFNRPASTPKGPAAFALKMNAPIIMGFIIRESNGRQKIVIEEPIFMQRSKNKENDIQSLTQAYTSMLEGYIRKYPDHWFWPHRRWKSTTDEY